MSGTCRVFGSREAEVQQAARPPAVICAIISALIVSAERNPKNNQPSPDPKDRHDAGKFEEKNPISQPRSRGPTQKNLGQSLDRANLLLQHSFRQGHIRRKKDALRRMNSRSYMGPSSMGLGR